MRGGKNSFKTNDKPSEALEGKCIPHDHDRNTTCLWKSWSAMASLPTYWNLSSLIPPPLPLRSTHRLWSRGLTGIDVELPVGGNEGCIAPIGFLHPSSGGPVICIPQTRIELHWLVEWEPHTPRSLLFLNTRIGTSSTKNLPKKSHYIKARCIWLWLLKKK